MDIQLNKIFHKLSPKDLLVIFSLFGLSVIGNWGYIPAFYGGIDFVFGTIFLIPIMRLYGMAWGLSAALISNLIFHHEFGSMISGMLYISEIFTIGILLNKIPKNNIVLQDLIFWVFIGIPLAFVLQHDILGASTSDTSLVCLKYIVNGLTNALYSGIICTLILTKFYSREEIEVLQNPSLPRPIGETIFNLSLFLATIPVILGNLIFVYHTTTGNEHHIKELIKDNIQTIQLYADQHCGVSQNCKKVLEGNFSEMSRDGVQSVILSKDPSDEERKLVKNLMDPDNTLKNLGDDILIRSTRSSKKRSLITWENAYVVKVTNASNYTLVSYVDLNQKNSDFKEQLIYHLFAILLFFVLMIYMNHRIGRVISMKFNDLNDSLESMRYALKNKFFRKAIANFQDIGSEYSSMDELSKLSENLRSLTDEIKESIKISGKLKWERKRLESNISEEQSLINTRLSELLYERTRSEKSVISELERSESELENLRRIKVAVDNHSSIIISNLGGTVLDVNEMACSVLEASREDLVGQTSKLIGYSTKDNLDFWDMVSTGKIWSDDVLDKTETGKEYWSRITVTPFLDDNGIPEMYIAVKTDITDLK